MQNNRIWSIYQPYQIGKVEQPLNDKKVIPEFLISTPKDVVKDLIKGLKNKELHIYPGIVSQSIDLITRFFPGMMEALSRKQIAQ